MSTPPITACTKQQQQRGMTSAWEDGCEPIMESQSNQWWNHERFRRTRIIPVLLLHNGGFVKTVKFRNAVYLGDPMNIVRIFNEKEVDEIVILDISTQSTNAEPRFSLLADIAGECFMPATYGGGIRTLDDIRHILALGFEKVCINTHALERPQFIREAADRFGSSTIVISLDVKQSLFGGYDVYVRGGRTRLGLGPVSAAQMAQQMGAGELLVNCINRDGTRKGYDIPLLQLVTDAVDIPVVACGGADGPQDLLAAAVKGRASGVAAGSMFVFHGRRQAVLIHTPSPQALDEVGIP